MSYAEILKRATFENIEAVVLKCFLKKMLLKIYQISQENTQSLFLNKVQAQASNFIKKQTLAQVFSYESCKIFKNTFFIEDLRWLNIHDLLRVNEPSYFLLTIYANLIFRSCTFYLVKARNLILCNSSDFIKLLQVYFCGVQQVS